MAEPLQLGPWYRGEDLAPVFTIKPVEDITGWTISLRVKVNKTDAASLLTITASNTTPASGIFTVAISAAQSATLSPGTYVVDIWRTDSGSACALGDGTVSVLNTVRVP